MGLGLTISYEIVVDEHHSQLRVDSQEGEYTEFTILIPRT
jgi:signal transduction histidine kinase